MKTLTYKEAYDKIIDAYFKDEIEPLRRQFCFCGTLCDNSKEWYGFGVDLLKMKKIHNDSHGYTGAELLKMEDALLHTMRNGGIRSIMWLREKNPILYEEALFAGMCAALEILKQIHMERCDYTVNDTPLKKRVGGISNVTIVKLEDFI